MLHTRARPATVATRWICESCRVRQATRRLSTAPQRSEPTTASFRPPRGKLPNTPARTRFAPSPTGNLHLGSIRTALFNYLLARATKGQFLLRIEDTDAKRTVPGAEEQLYKDLRWAGLQWDEGPQVGGPHGPYRQSERLPLYKTHIQTLLDTGQAYRCFCTTDRLHELNTRRHEKGLSLGYDRKCQHTISQDQAEERARQGEAHVIRFLSPTEWPKYHDLIYGKAQGHGAERTQKLLVDEPVYEDPILMKSDGFPTYHFANVVDDHDMQITHVVRGSEWMSSTPLHVALYDSFNWSSPAYAHVPLLVDANRQKISKRNFDSDISSFRNRGLLPEALVNFAALLGWSHKRKKDVMDLAELEELFDLKITKGNVIVSSDKLEFLQLRHGRRLIAAEGPVFEQIIRDIAVAVLDTFGADRVLQLLNSSGEQKRDLRSVIVQLLRIESLPYLAPTQFAEQCALFFEPITLQDSDLGDLDASLFHALRTVAGTILLIPPARWTKDTLHAHLRALEASVPPASAEGQSPDAKAWKQQLYQYLRWALTGVKHGPGIAETLEILGRETCMQRFKDADVRVRAIEEARAKEQLRATGFRGTPEGKRRIEKEWTRHSL